MACVEIYGLHQQEDWAIRFMARELERELEPFIIKKELPYFRATMEAIAEEPSVYRNCGYSTHDMRFSDHRRDKRGRLLSCVAKFQRFDGEARTNDGETGGASHYQINRETGSAKPVHGRSV